MLFWLLSAAALAQDPTWNSFAKLQTARTNACVASLGATGRVLMIGGNSLDGAATAAVEILSTDGIAQITTPLNTPRTGHTCTLMNDGRVLVTGGSFRGANGEVYDPVSEVWIPIASAGPSRAGSTATLLQDGRVLIAGGYTQDDSLLPYAEIFDPYSNRYTASRGQLNQPRRAHTATLLNDGRVVFAGGAGLDGATLRSSEWYDPLTSIIWSGPDLTAARRNHAAVTLEDGRVLVTGGNSLTGPALASVEVLDAQNTRWTALNTRLNIARSGHTAQLIAGNGGVLINSGGTAASEYFDASNNSFKTLNELDASGAGFAASADGTVVACGGMNVNDEVQDTCSQILFPAISFPSRVYHPQETVRVSGRNLPANATVSFAVDFVRGSALNTSTTAAPQFRILTARTTTNSSGAFTETPLLLPLNTDIGSRLRLTATMPNASTIVRHVPLKYISTLSYALPTGTVEGQNTALRVEVSPVNGAPLPSGSITSTFGPVTLVELLNTTASASYSSLRLPTGALTVTSVYPGDAYYDAAINRTSLGVASRTPVIDVVSSVIAPQVGVPFTVYAQIRVDATSGVAGGPPITGAVTIFESGVAIGRARVLTTSTVPYPQILTSVEYTTLRLAPDLRFSATFAGDTNYRQTSSGVLVTLIQRATSAISLVAVPSIFNLKPAPGVPVRFHCDVPTAFNVGLNFPPPLNLGNYGFTIAATSVTGSVTKLGEGGFDIAKPGVAAAQTIVTIPNDTLRVTADFSGDGFIRAATSEWVLVKLIPVPVSVTFVDLPVKVTTDFMTLTASVVNDAGKGCKVDEPSGEIEFFIGTATLGRFPLRSNGASLRIQRPFETGTQDFFIRYYGDSLHTPTDSAIVTVKFE